jgi:hypothetical protein
MNAMLRPQEEVATIALNSPESCASLSASVAPEEVAATSKWEMKELKPWHKQFCSLLAQGIDRETIATVLEITPTYVSMLSKQPLIQAYIREMCQFASLQLEAQFAKGVAIIGEVMDTGNGKERLQAVRLNAELTHRIGSGSGLPAEATNTEERLLRLAERLLTLQEKTAPIPTIPLTGEYHDITKSTEPEQYAEAVGRTHQPTQEDGDGSADPER